MSSSELMFSVFVPGLFPGSNEIIEVRSSRWRGKWNELKKKCANAVANAVQGYCVLPKRKYTVVFTWYEWTDGRDPDNIGGACKPILDALQHLGIIENDTQEWIESTTNRIRYAETMDRVGVLVEFWIDDRLKDLRPPAGRNPKQITCRIYEKPKKGAARRGTKKQKGILGE
jgi:Holliday junction resolvase RusA-like endonuclease